MNHHPVISHAFGRVQRGGDAHWEHGYYLPALLPRTLQVSDTLRREIESAEWSLARLSGLSEAIVDVDLLMRPATIHEALSSSRVEGSQATLAEVIAGQAERRSILREDVREVLNLHDAVLEGLDMLATLPLAGRVLTSLHRTLLSDVRGREKQPGFYRNAPVWVGAEGDGPERATFIPPLPHAIGDLVADWEAFVNQPPAMPLVIRLAVAHHQFETIHPFFDGNGRMGRLLIGLHLVKERILPWPIVTLSTFINQERDRYYKALQGVRDTGDIEPWISFFCEAIDRESSRAYATLLALEGLRSTMRAEAIGQPKSVRKLIDTLFAHPVVTIARVESSLGVSQPTASRTMRVAESLGWVESLGQRGRGRKEHWVAPGVWNLHSSETPEMP